ncbi:MAG: PEP_CTERM-anchored TLD domain-containing protein, partial [Pseudomonadota bacterium]
MSVMRRVLSAVAILAGLSVAPTAHAATVTGGSAILSSSDANQLETWLGEGPIELTNIFTRQTGNSAAMFHAAVDGMGRTISVIALDNGNVVGGYNPISWAGPNGYKTSGDLSAFLFNLTTGEKLEQFRYPQWQTHYRSNYGPTFGGGHDLHINNALTGGYANIGHTYETPVGTVAGATGQNA